MKNKKNIIISVLIVVIAMVGIWGYNNYVQSKAVEGEKQIVVTVVNELENYKKQHKHNTDAVNLGEALKEMEIAEIENGQYGQFLVGVDNIKADESKQEWWKIIANGKDAETGMDLIMINDGDKFELILTVGW